MRTFIAALLAVTLSAGMLPAAAAENPAGRTDAEIQQTVVTREGENNDSIGSLLLELARLTTREDVRELMQIEDFHLIVHEVIFKVLVWMVENRPVTMKILAELGLSEEDLRAVYKIWDSSERIAESIREYGESEAGKKLEKEAEALGNDPEYMQSLVELVDLINENTVTGTLQMLDRLFSQQQTAPEEEAPGALSREAEKRQMDRESFTGQLLTELLRVVDLNAEVSDTILKILKNEHLWAMLLQITNGSRELDEALRQEFNSLGKDEEVNAFLKRLISGMDKAVDKMKDLTSEETQQTETQQTEEEEAK